MSDFRLLDLWSSFKERVPLDNFLRIHRVIGKKQVGVPLLILGAMTVMAGGTRALYFYSEGKDLTDRMHGIEEEIGELDEVFQLGSHGRGVSRGGSGKKGVEQAIPIGEAPGDILAELLLALRDSGIDSYAYELRPEGSAEETGEWTDDADESEDDDLAFDSFSDDEESGFDDLEETMETSSSGMTLPPGISGWKISLRLQAPYRNVILFLGLLESSPRFWRVPETRIDRTSDRVRAEITLYSYTRGAGDAGSDLSMVDGSPAEDSTGPFDVTDPFHKPVSRVISSGTRVKSDPIAPPPPLPHLGAIRFGETRSVWIDGESRNEGDSIGGWTLFEIRHDRVLLRAPDTSTHELRVPKHVLYP